MILPTEYEATKQQLNYLKDLCNSEHKMVLNKPTGDFFYDPWVVNEEYKGTPVESFLAQIPDAGEARIIKQESGTCYFAHSDICTTCNRVSRQITKIDAIICHTLYSVYVD